mgnify:CR=1 FL=1
MKYIEESYPDMKLLGNLANFWGIRSFHAADLKFNEQYYEVFHTVNQSDWIRDFAPKLGIGNFLILELKLPENINKFVEIDFKVLEDKIIINIKG